MLLLWETGALPEEFREELLLITEESELNLVSDQTTWVVDSRESFHLTPD